MLGVTRVRQWNFPPMHYPYYLPTGLVLEGGDGTLSKKVQIQQEGLELKSKKDLPIRSSTLLAGVKGGFQTHS